jgi:hypothetical protein
MSYFSIDEVENRFPDDMLVSLMGGTYDFYGVDGDSFCIGLNGARMVLEAVEDPSDGYRSYFGCFRTTNVGKIFFGSPISRVVLREGGKSSRTYCYCYDDTAREGQTCSTHLEEQKRNFTGWVLEDEETGHAWLTVGTDFGDSYYPCFTFNYQPDTSKTIEDSHDD